MRSEEVYLQFYHFPSIHIMNAAQTECVDKRQLCYNLWSPSYSKEEAKLAYAACLRIRTSKR